MRKDLIVGGAVTGVLMLVVTWILGYTSLPVPVVMSQIILVVTLIALGTLVLGVVLPSAPGAKRRGGSDRERL